VSRIVVLFVVGAVLTTAAVAFVFLRPTSEEDSPTASAVAAPESPERTTPAPSPSTAPAGTSRPAPRRAAAAPTPADARAESAAAVPDAAPAAPTAGVLTVQSDVSGAQVFIDRRFVGNAPVTIPDLTPGSHQLNVSADGFEGIARTIDVEAGARDMTVRFREVRLDAALPIVHKHRIGSCTGRLVASADGIRYETADKNDAFTAMLSDIETFEVNYQERNLRIKLRKGRDYNFTDPERDADRLFVFHRDVERARGLLAKGYQPATD